MRFLSHVALWDLGFVRGFVVVRLCRIFALNGKQVVELENRITACWKSCWKLWPGKRNWYGPVKCAFVLKPCSFHSHVFFLFSCHSTVVTMTYCQDGCSCSCLTAQWASKSLCLWSNSYSEYLWGLPQACMSPVIPPFLMTQTHSASCREVCQKIQYGVIIKHWSCSQNVIKGFEADLQCNRSVDSM